MVMMTDTELARIKKRAMHLLDSVHTLGENSVLGKMLEGDARDTLALCDEISRLKFRIKPDLPTGKILTEAELAVLLKIKDERDKRNA